MEWMRAVQLLRSGRRAGVLVTVMSVRGHAPREAGAKMVVASDNVWSTVGGGNLEALAVERSRELIAAGATEPEVLEVALSDKAPYQHGVQCCGGEVKLLLEPLPVVPSVAIFGIGHVGLELARILARHDIELHLVDSRSDQLTVERLAVLDDAVAQVHVHNVPVLPELVVGELPPGTHTLVMTHDHAEDAALCDAAIRNEQLATIGPDRVEGEVGPVPPQARRGRQLRGRDRPHHHAVLVVFAILNSSLANANSGATAATRTLFAMGRVRLLPGWFAAVHPTNRTPVNAVHFQAISAIIIAVVLGVILANDPFPTPEGSSSFGGLNVYVFLGTMLGLIFVFLYIMVNLACIGYFWRQRRDEFNFIKHLIVPVLGVVAMIPAGLAVIGGRYDPDPRHPASAVRERAAVHRADRGDLDADRHRPRLRASGPRTRGARPNGRCVWRRGAVANRQR